jgi:two-component system nitrate/nitrite response regulator NarL
MSVPISVFIIDDHAEVRQALKTRLSSAPDMRVVGETGEAEEAIQQLRRLRADIVLIESKRADGRGLEIISWIAQGRLAGAVIVLTSYPSEWERWAAHRAGATHYLLKDIDSPVLIDQIRRAAAERFISVS